MVGGLVGTFGIDRRHQPIKQLAVDGFGRGVAVVGRVVGQEVLLHLATGPHVQLHRGQGLEREREREVGGGWGVGVSV